VTVDTSTNIPDAARIRSLWAANLLGPLASLVGLELGYVLAERACVTGQTLPLHLSFLGTLLLATLGSLLGWREWRRGADTPDGENGGRAERSRFLALLGMIAGGLFGLTILAQWSASLFLHPCQ
jgi:hypothetical protein